MIEDYQIEKDESDFQEQLEANRYAELIGLLKKYLPQLNKDNIVSALQNNNSIVSEFVNQLRNLKFEVPEIPTPKVIVNTDNKEIATAIGAMANNILKNQIELKQLFQTLIDKKTDYTMKVTHWNILGRIDEVTIKAI